MIRALRPLLLAWLRAALESVAFDAGEVFLFDSEWRRLRLAIHVSDSPGYLAESEWCELDQGYPEIVVQNKDVVYIPDLTGTDCLLGSKAARAGYRQFIGIPLRTAAGTIGLLMLASKRTRIPGSMEFAELTRLSELLALAIHCDRPYVTRQDGTVFSYLIRLLHGKDPATEMHSRHMLGIAFTLARQMGFAERDFEWIRLGCLFHDIGKIAIPNHVLCKPGPLDDEERARVRQHPEIGYDILLPVGLPPPALDIVRHHHERYDGSGYPGELAGGAIPLIARIAAVADALDAMTSDRPYRPTLEPKDALAEMNRYSGSQFDPAVCDAVSDAVQSDGNRALRCRRGRLWYLSDEQLDELIEVTRCQMRMACDSCVDRDGPKCPASCPSLRSLETDMDAWVTEWAVRRR